MIYVLGLILIGIIIYLIIQLNHKQQIDKNELDLHIIKINELNKQEIDASTRLAKTNADLAATQTHLDTITQFANKEEKRYKEALNKKNTSLDEAVETKKKFCEHLIEEEKKKAQEQQEEIKDSMIQVQAEYDNWKKTIEEDIQLAKKQYEALIAPIKQYEMEQQQRLFYTIQIPDEYKDDIDFLLINVAPKINHPDIINKLIWNEYVKPYIEETFKRISIKDDAGIYKLTNIENGKAYIGKSTNVKKRITDHFKSSIGITSIADQAVHHEILKTGLWNWTIEIIMYCEKDKLNEMEKYYIDFFDTVNNGFNKNKGGGG